MYGEKASTTEPPGFALSAWLFLRLLAATYLIAFASLAVQVDGLIGSQGIAPVDQLLPWLERSYGAERYLLLPTLLWVNTSDAFLHLICGAGILLAVLVLADVAPAPGFLLLWVLYLSLVTAGQDFLAFQWDSLLLEAGLLGVFLAPWRFRRGPPAEPLPVFRLLLWWLLFRLMFSSAVVKLSSGDPTWRDLTALTFHYETQPLPTWTAWYMHQLPVWFHRLSALVMFVSEGLVPFLIAGPRRGRHLAAFALVGLQLLIAATGNYTFFNLLAIALCLFLLDDRALGAVGRRIHRVAQADTAPVRSSRNCPQWVAIPVATLVGGLSLVPITLLARQAARLPGPVLQLYRRASSFRVVNNYGLFAVMTTRRPEIVIEGSRDGIDWRAYEFRWKPGDLGRPPAFVEPHQPRLDWQMWFAALGSCPDSPWLIGLFQRLLEGSPLVRRLFAGDPFPDAPPRLVRAVRYDYHFTNRDERARTGHWWRREPLGPFCDAMSLE